jgi:D-alanyl-D-alanine carboxypeptidase
MKKHKTIERIKNLQLGFRFFPRLAILIFSFAVIAGLYSPANAATESVQGMAQFSGDTLRIPLLSVDDKFYDISLTLHTAAEPNQFQFQLATYTEIAQPASLDGSAFFENDVLSIPIINADGSYFSLNLQPNFIGDWTVKPLFSTDLFQIKDLWNVELSQLAVPITGLNFSSGSLTGATDSQGRFYPEKGSQIDFSVDKLAIGSATSTESGKQIKFSSLFSLGEKDPVYIRALRVLELLDSDSNSVNGISLDVNLKLKLGGKLASMNLSSESFEADYSELASAVVLDNSAAKALDATEAEINFQKLEIQTYMKSQLAANSVPGVSLSIELPNGEVWHTAAGIANIESQTLMTPEHKLRIGSSTKSFTGMFMMQLVDEGRLSLDQTLESFFPGKFPHGDETTIKMLLNHTAGLFSFTDAYPGFDSDFGVTLDTPLKFSDLWFVRYMGMPGFQYADGELTGIGANVNSSFAKNNATESRPYLLNKPGEKFNYSNTHYVLLQEIGELITGNSWDSEIKSRFIDKFGLTNTDVPSPFDFEMQGTHAEGYINWANFLDPQTAAIFGYPDADVNRTDTSPSFTMGSGAIVSTTEDLAKWANAVMEGQVLSPTTQALMMEPFSADAFGTEVDILQGVIHEKGLQVFGHRGQIAGFDASWQYHYRDINDIVGTGTAIGIVLNRTLLFEEVDGRPFISNVNLLMLKGILDILYDSE